MRHEKQIEIRWRDVDAYEHVNNAVYATYLEECRDEWLERALGDAGDPWDFVLARVAIDFRASSASRTRPCRVVPPRPDRDLEPDLARGGPDRAGELSAESEAVVVARDRANGGSRPLTDVERAAFERAIVTSSRPGGVAQETEPDPRRFPVKRLLFAVAALFTLVALAGAVGLPDLAGAQDAADESRRSPSADRHRRVGAERGPDVVRRRVAAADREGRHRGQRRRMRRVINALRQAGGVSCDPVGQRLPRLEQRGRRSRRATRRRTASPPSRTPTTPPR